MSTVNKSIDIFYFFYFVRLLFNVTSMHISTRKLVKAVMVMVSNVIVPQLKLCVAILRSSNTVEIKLHQVIFS